jgi:hypothetical protein
MKALRRLVTGTMLGLGLTFGAVEANAQSHCHYEGTMFVLYDDGTWEAYDVYYCH